MASIDKTYGRKLDCIIFAKWFKENKSKINDAMGYVQYLYNDLDEYTNPDNFPNPDSEMIIWNTSTAFDVWLIKNCKLTFIQDRLEGQYGKQFVELIKNNLEEYDNKIRVWQYKLKGKDKVYFYNYNNKQAYYFNKMLVYGTTTIFKQIDKLKTQIWHRTKNKTKAIITYYGLDLQYKNGKFYLLDTDNKEEVNIPSIMKEDLHFPKLKHTYNTKDSKGYKPQSILLSDEKHVFCAYDFKGANVSQIKRYCFSLPNYISNLIK